MESTSISDVRLLRGMIDDHQNDLLQERTRLEALRIEWSRKSMVANRLREAGLASQAAVREDESRVLHDQIGDMERRIARIEELIGILRRRQQEL